MRTPCHSLAFVTAAAALSGCRGPSTAPAATAAAARAPSVVDTWLGHTGPVHGLSLSPDPEAVVSAGDDATLRVWNVATGASRAVLTGHTHHVWAAAFASADEVVSAGFDGTVKRWDVARAAEVHSASSGGTAQGAACLAVSADGRRIATGGFDSLVRLWDIGAAAPRATCRGHSDTVWAVVFAPDGERVYSGSFDGSIRVWNGATGACLATWTEADPEGRGWKRAFALAPDGRTLLCAGATVPREWDLATGAQLAPFRAEVATSTISIAASTDGRRIATGGFDGHLAIWDRASRTLVARWPAEQGDGVWAVTFLPDGQLLSAGDSGTIKRWRLAP